MSIFKRVRKGNKWEISAQITDKTMSLDTGKKDQRITALELLKELLKQWGDVEIDPEVVDNGAVLEKTYSKSFSGDVSRELQQLAEVSVVSHRYNHHKIVPIEEGIE